MNHGSGENRCSRCGVALSASESRKLHTVVRGLSGKPNVHAVWADGEVIHRCEVRQASEPWG